MYSFIHGVLLKINLIVINYFFKNKSIILNVKNKTNFFITFILLFGSLFSCNSNENNKDIKDDDTIVNKEITLSDCINNTKNNYTSIEIQKAFDNSENEQSFTKRIRNVDLNNNKVFFKYSYLLTSDLEEFNSYLNDEYNWTYYCYFKEDENIKRRYKNAANDFIWKEDSKYHNDYFDDLFFNKVDTNLFYKVNDSLYSLKEEYLSSEEVSKLTTFYGSYSYFNQDFSYFNIEINEGKISKLSYEVHFTSREGSSISGYDKTTEVNVEFKDIGTTEFEIPSLPIYAEDLLKEDERLLKAKENTMNNYTYHESYKVIDENGNSDSRVFDEIIDGESSYTNVYNESINNYIESYEYYIDKESFAGGVSHRLQEVTLIHSDDKVTYSTYDVGVVDESYNRVYNLGASYGVKIFKYVEDGDYFTPLDGGPENNNKDNKTYLYIASANFINSIIGNYTSNSGITYLYEINDFKVYIEDEKLKKVTYDYTLYLTENDETKTYNYIGIGEFSNVGDSAIIIPTDPNDEIELDSRLEDLYEKLDCNNYSYEEDFYVEDSSGEKLPFYTFNNNSFYDGKYYEYQDDEKIKRTLYGLYYSSSDDSEIEYGLIDDYYYYGRFNVYNYYEILDGSDRSYSLNYEGSYSFSSYTSKLKEYLKYFEYSRTNNKGNLIFNLKDDYLEHYGNLLIESVNDNATLDFAESMQLIVKADGKVTLSYDYKTYDDSDNFIGYCIGEINLFDIGETEVIIPGFDSSYIDSTFENLINKYIQNNYYISTSDVEIKSYGTNKKQATYQINGGSSSLVFDETNDPFLFIYDKTSSSIKVNLSCNNTYKYSEVYSDLEFDLSKLNFDYLSLSNDVYWIDNSYIDLFYEDVLNMSGSNYNFISACFKIDENNELVIELQYQIRIKNDKDRYEVFYISSVNKLTY